VSAVTYVGRRELEVFYDGAWKVTLDPEEGSTACECPDFQAWVASPDPYAPRCDHQARVWRAWHTGDYEEESW